MIITMIYYTINETHTVGFQYNQGSINTTTRCNYTCHNMAIIVHYDYHSMTMNQQ